MNRWPARPIRANFREVIIEIIRAAAAETTIFQSGNSSYINRLPRVFSRLLDLLDVYASVSTFSPLYRGGINSGTTCYQNLSRVIRSLFRNIRISRAR